MTERATRDKRVQAINRLIYEITWHVQKQAIRTLMRPDIDLTMPQLVALFAIYDSGTCRMGALAEATRQSGGTITGIVDRLIECGLVARAQNAHDRRVVEVALTPEGETRVRRAIGARYTDMDRILALFGEGQLAQFEQLLRLFMRGVYSSVPCDEPLPLAAEG